MPFLAFAIKHIAKNYFCKGSLAIAYYCIYNNAERSFAIIAKMSISFF
jgi:hypothetical protein